MESGKTELLKVMHFIAKKIPKQKLNQKKEVISNRKKCHLENARTECCE